MNNGHPALNGHRPEIRLIAAAPPNLPPPPATMLERLKRWVLARWKR